MKNHILPLLFFLLAGRAAAQCVVIQNCPTIPNVILCDASDNNDQFWNDPAFFDNVVGSHNLAEAAADLSISATNTCNGNGLSFRYQLFLDLNGDGIQETVIDSKTPPPAGKVYIGNAGNPNYVGGALHAFDQRSVAPYYKYRFSLQVKGFGPTRTASVRWRTEGLTPSYTVPQLPYGNHKIKWIVTDAQGHSQTCTYNIQIQDCAPPSVTCLSGLAVNIMPTQIVTVWATDFLQSATDNYTPSNQLKYGVRRSGAGTGFPVDADGNPITRLDFLCSETGTHNVELWAMDLAGNTSFCETQLAVNDNSLNCDSTTGSFSLCVKTTKNDGLDQVSYWVTVPPGPGSPGFQYTVTDDLSACLHGIPDTLPVTDLTTIAPQKLDNPLNGVTTFDWVLIEQHIKGVHLFTSPWQYVAADVDENGVIDTNDLILCRALIVGAITEFPSGESWRMIRSDYVFPANPLQGILPESVTLAELHQTAPNPVYFTAVKLGDVNGSAIANNADAPSADRNQPASVQGAVVVSPVRPNPTNGPAVIPINLPAAAAVSLEVFDLNGRLTYAANQWLDAGESQLNIPGQALPATGLFTWRVRVQNAVFQGKVVRIQ